MIKKRTGFSIVELLISIAIVSMVIVMVCILYSYMMKVSSKGVDISIGTQIAENKINEITSDESNESLRKNISSVSSGNAYVTTGVDKTGNTDYYWLLKITSVSGTNYSKMNLFFVDVLVFWWADDSVSVTNTDGTVENKTLAQIATQFDSDDYFSDEQIINTLGAGKAKNLNEGYKFVRLSRIISNK